MRDKKIEQKLSKLQALYFGAQTEGEKRSAIKAKARVLKNLANNIEYKFSLKHKTNAEIFIDILNKYDISGYRVPDNTQTTIIAKVPGVFIDNILWPEYMATHNRVLV